MEENIKKSFAEVHDILLHSDNEIQEKIPEKLKSLIKENKDKNYEFKIDYSKNINEQELLPETRDILALIYRDYLCEEEERTEIIERNNEYWENKYDVHKVLEKRKQEDSKKIEETRLVKVEKKKLFQKILDYILKILKK